jgi:hypothetical protein
LLTLATKVLLSLALDAVVAGGADFMSGAGTLIAPALLRGQWQVGQIKGVATPSLRNTQ